MTNPSATLDRRAALRMITAAAGCLFCAGAAHAEGPGAWSYEGETGPDKWDRLAPENRVCAVGQEQTPIDLAGAVRSDLGPLKLDWPAGKLRVVNNGHTIQVNCDPGGKLVLPQGSFDLVQFHFHHPAEHLLAGKQLDLECHFVHRAASGALAVVGVFIKPGAQNEMLQRIWSHLPDHAGPEQKHDVTIDPAALLPAERGYFRYQGSLTTPPCSEGVVWSVLKQPIEASPDQIRAFARLFPNNARPVMPRRQRQLFESA